MRDLRRIEGARAIPRPNGKGEKMTDVMRIDYWDIVSRSVRTAWKYKLLWFFGFFASSGGGNVGQWNEHGSEWFRDFFITNPALLALIVMGVVILAIVFLVMNVICTGGLISSTSAADRGLPISFSRTWRAGLSAFWRLLGISLLAILTFLAVSALCAIPVVLSLLGGAPGIVVAVLIGAILFLPYVAFLFLLSFTVLYGERAVVLENAAVFEALRDGWELTKKHLGRSMLMWLVMFLSGMVFTLGMVISLLVLAIPFVLIGLGNLLVALVLGIPVGVAFIVLASGAYNTYAYSAWTLAYETLNGRSAQGRGSFAPPANVASWPSLPRGEAGQEGAAGAA